MNNSFKTLLEYSILKDYYRGGYFQPKLTDVMWIFCRVDLLNWYVEGFCNFCIDWGLLHTPHTPRRVKTDHTHCQKITEGEIKRVCGIFNACLLIQSGRQQPDNQNQQ